MPELAPATLTPEETAEFNKLEQTAAPANKPINPIKDLSSQELFELSTKDPDNFDLVHEVLNQPGIENDAAVMEKVEQAHNLVKQRGFKMEDLPGPKKIGKTVVDTVAGFGRQAWNYANAGVAQGMSIGAAALGAPQSFSDALDTEAQHRVAENIAGSESAVTGLYEMGKRGVEKFGQTTEKISRKLGGVSTTKLFSEYTPEEKHQDFKKALEAAREQKEILRGHGPVLQAAGSEVVKDLEAQGKPINPEETQKLAAGDPFSWWAFGKALKPIEEGVGAVAKLSPVGIDLTKGASKALGETGESLAGAGKVYSALEAMSSPAVGKTVGAVAGGVGGAVTGTKLGHPIAGVTAGITTGARAGQLIAGGIRKTAQTVAKSAATAGTALEDLGKQIGGSEAVNSAFAQLAKDVVESAPGAAGNIARGAALDVGIAAATSESPQETQGIGLGTALGALGGAARTGQHVLSGQIIGPRAFGATTVTPSSGKFSTLDAMHQEAFESQTPGVKLRLNAIRQFVKGAVPDADVFLAKDAASLESALVQSGVSPEQAKTLSQQLGFFTAELPDKDGQPRRVIFARDIEAAPHESFHAIQDVLGEGANRQIDALVKQEYAGQWEQYGEDYAKRLGVDLTSFSWEEGILDRSGWGLDAAKEKLTKEYGSPKAAADIMRMIIDGAKERNPEASEQNVWRDILSPEEAKAEADRYIARELAAENFDALFKHTGPALQENSLVGKLANVVAKLMLAFGAEPLAGRTTAVGRVEPKFRVTEAVRKASLELPKTENAEPAEPVVTPTGATPKPTLPPTPPTPPAPAEAAKSEAAKLKDWIAKNKITVPDRAKAAETMADAISNEQVLQVIYYGAKGEQGGSIDAERPERRAEIEAQRDADNADRPLVRKTFFPERVEVTSKGPQILGWSPDNFFANANRLAAWAEKTKIQLPYEIKDGKFTDAGWKALQADAKTFMQNQRAGATGAGEPLIVPKKTLARGFTQPKAEGASAKIDQTHADIINYLFGTKIPVSTSRVATLHIAGQEISEATSPGRVEVPVVPRGEYSDKQLTNAGINEPRGVREVNPFRQRVEQVAQQTGIAAPELIEVSQRLNLNRIADATIAPEATPVRANTLTLAAGFQPERSNDDPRAIKSAASRWKPTGQIFEGPIHSVIMEKALEGGVDARVKSFDDLNNISKEQANEIEENFEHGFITHGGEFLDRDKALSRALAKQQIKESDLPSIKNEIGGGLGAWEFGTRRQFQPELAKEPEAVKAPAVRTAAGKIYVADQTYPTHYGAMEKARLAGDTNKVGAQDRHDFKKQGLVDGFVTNEGEFLTRKQAFKRAKEYGQITGEEPMPRPGELESVHFESAAGRGPQYNPETGRRIWTQFQPARITDEVAKMSPDEFRNWAMAQKGGFTSTAYDVGRSADSQEFVDSLKANADNFLKLAKDKMLSDEPFDQKMNDMVTLASQGQFFNEAWQFATGEGSGGESARKEGFEPKYSSKKVEKTLDNRQEMPHTAKVQLQPTSSEEIRKVAEDYAKRAGIDYAPARTFAPVNEELAKRLADHYESAKSDPDNAEVQKSYAALADETVQQYHAMTAAGIHAEPWTSEGEPYKSSADMVNDVRTNRHIWYLPTKEAFGSGKEAKNNPMLADSGIEINGEPVLINDLFRAVHDFFGHAKEGYQFGPRGEFNAWREHSEMFSPDAQGALAAETLAQNSWVNYGKHLRDSTGRIAAKGEQNYVAPASRPFAEQKNIVIPPEMISEVRGKAVSAQAQPESSEKDFKFPAKSSSGFKKAWILPNGRPVQLGGEWHSKWLDDNRDIAKQFGMIDIPKFEGSDGPGVRENALKKGFARVNYAVNSGTLTVEARAADWPKQKEVVRQLVEANIGDVDNMRVNLTDEGGSQAVRSESAKLFNYDDAEKLNHLPLMEDDVTARPETGPAESEALRPDTSYNASDSYFKTQAQPRDEELSLPGIGGKKALSSVELSDMTKDEISAYYPEAIIPKKRDESIPSRITESPLYKLAGDEAGAVKAFADKLVKFAKENENNPSYAAGAEWYSDFVPKLKKEFGKDARLMAELLAATSPQTNVTTNFAYAFDALSGIKSGRFDKIIAKFNQGLAMLENETWLGWYAKELKAGRVVEPPAEPTPAAFLAHWIVMHDLKPKQSNGKLYGQHSLPVLQVFARRWMDLNAGPKTRNFVANLLGEGHEATIDLWADRTMRRAGYSDTKERWRILPKNAAPVSDADFAFAQKVFRAAAEQLGMKPDALQGALWFAEKQLWADNGWSTLDLGDFRREMEKLPLLRRGIEQRSEKTRLAAKNNAPEQVNMFDQPSLVEPRKMVTK